MKMNINIKRNRKGIRELSCDPTVPLSNMIFGNDFKYELPLSRHDRIFTPLFRAVSIYSSRCKSRTDLADAVWRYYSENPSTDMLKNDERIMYRPSIKKLLKKYYKMKVANQ